MSEKNLMDKDEIQLIIFELGDEEYAVPINCVQEIIMHQTPTRIPKSPDFVEGVINLRGNIIPVIDGKKKFQLNPKKERKSNESRIIILESNENTISLVVDAVSEVVQLKRADIDPAPIECEEDKDFLLGIGKFYERLLILLNPERILNLSESKHIEQFKKLTKQIKEEQDNEF